MSSTPFDLLLPVNLLSMPAAQLHGCLRHYSIGTLDLKFEDDQALPLQALNDLLINALATMSMPTEGCQLVSNADICICRDSQGLGM